LYGNNLLENSYIFWPIVAQHKNARDALAFNTIAQYVLKILNLPMSNAAVKRVFSIMNATKDKLRNRMIIEMLNALLIIKSHFYANIVVKILFVHSKCWKNLILIICIYVKIRMHLKISNVKKIYIL